MEFRVLLWFLAVQWSYIFANGIKECPQNCSCLSTLVSCTRGNLSGIIQLLPSWVEVLDLSSNNLSDEFECDLSHLPNLTDLKLSKNSFTVVPLVGNLLNLRNLSLTHNKIRGLKAYSLQSLPVLENLNINNNLIEELSLSNFPSNNSLKILHASKNRIKIIHEGAFDNMRELAKLKLNKNKLSSIPKKLFQNQISLKTLELNENSFKELDALMFKGLENLEILKLQGNNMNDMKDGVFYGLTNINTLLLDRNNIKTISKGWLYGLNSLKTLSLTLNVISTIIRGCWESNGELQELDLSKNQLEIIYSNTFQHLVNLRVLKLDSNKISSIEENAFGHMPLLEVLELSHNQISWTVEDMNGPFAKLGSLVKFSLANNHIKSVSNKAFSGLKMLSWLDLNNNNITSVQEHAFDSLQSLKDLHMNSGNLLCDCKLQWLPRWLEKQTASASHLRATCAFPAKLNGKLLMQVGKDSFACDDSPNPRILEHPKKQLAIQGDTIRLYCKAMSSLYKQDKTEHHMTFHWKKNNINVTNLKMIYNESIKDDSSVLATSELVIPNVTSSDDGKYQCIVSNSYATTYSDKCKITFVIPPKFIKRPSNITVKSGETVKLECSASGKPFPQIAWQKDGGNDFPAARERRMHVMPTDHVFFIVNSNISDMGVYSCTAKNPAGVIISNASLTVYEAPSFVKSMVNKEITAGDSVVLECMMSGSPKPTLTWLKDGAPIMRTERHFFTAEDQLLIIVGAVQSDQGLYECVITNTLGSERDSTKLMVLQPTPTPVNEEDMKGIIIITIVCCAVGTSIIWVVFIYQTRKRSNSPTPQYPPEALPMATLPAETDQTATHIFSDNISERSSCKDSGTGDSAKRSSLEVIPIEEFPPELSRVSVYTEPQARHSGDEEHSLLRPDQRPSVHYYYEGDVDCVVNLSQLPLSDSCNEIRTFPYS